MGLLADIATISRPARHLIVEFLAPKLYGDSVMHHPLPRGMISAVKQKFGSKSLIGVEIGVFKGVHAKNILETLNIKMLYLVDPYKSYVDACSPPSLEELRKAFLVARHNLDSYASKIRWVPKSSEEAAENIPGDLDFIYIDGNHNYEFVKKDISLYYPKIKRGGILGGHNFEVKFRGVVQAVSEFTAKEELYLHGGPPTDWWVEKMFGDLKW